MNSKSFTLLGLAAACAAVSVRFMDSTPTIDSSPLIRDGSTEQAEEPSLALLTSLPRSEVIAPEPAPSLSVREQLQKYWGASAAAKVSEAEEQGIDLDAPSVFRTWEELREEALPHFTMGPEERSQLTENYRSWPEKLTAEYVARLDKNLDARSIDEAILLAVEHMVDPLNGDINREAERLVDMIANAKLSMLDSPLTSRSPYVSPDEVQQRPGDMLYSGGGAISHWKLNYTIFSSDFPEILPQKERVKSMRKERRAAVRSYLSTLN